MRYNPLGRTGLFVSELCLGTMTFGGSEGMWSQIGQVQQGEADSLLRTALDAGINFIDTADVYSAGLSEQITGQAIRNLGVARDEIVVATKAFGPTGAGPNSRGSSRYHLLDAAHKSLDRLGLDHIDLYHIHGWDPATPIDEIMRGLDDLVASGDVRYVGVSNWAAWQVMKALGISESRGFARFESVQAYYTIAGRDLERELAPMMLSEQVGLMVWSPLAGGLLSGKYDRDGQSKEGGRRATFDFPPVDKERAFAAIEAMRPIAEARDVSVAQVAIAWLLHQRHVTSVIVGAKRVEQLADNIGAAALELTVDELAALDAASRLPLEYPGWMIERQGEYRSGQLNQRPRTGRG